ncbi:MAG TPA: hypothetical protein VNK41_12840 [Vicinamibacterales bacterium]|nr:hypothetical protein [Vicinamibacterales bacterium]
MLQARSVESTPSAALDVLRWPVVGRFLRWRHARRSSQVALLAVAAIVVLHGLTGPQLAPQNLGTVLTWVHYRGLLILTLLAAGNLFCFGCPFILVRDAARRIRQPRRSWPRPLRTKWVGIVLLVAVLFAYELFDLWALPAGTAWLVVGYFAAAVAIDLVFTGAGFCKYVCPIGQFNFAASTVSPLGIQARDQAICRSCATVDCIRGRRDAARPDVVTQRGCELNLFIPSKKGNLDCTFCLDCVQACPHDNVAIAARAPGAELADDTLRSSIGRPSRRMDLAVLAVVFTFGALLNAFAMTSPVYALEKWIASTLETRSEAVVLLLVFVVALVVAPVVLLGGASLLTGLAVPAASRPRTAATFRRFAASLLPLGFALWLAHYGFHFLTGVLTIVPVTQSAALDLFGRPVLGGPWWTWAGMQPGSVLPFQLGVVLLGALGSAAIAYDIAEREHRGAAVRAMMPWALVIVLIAAVSMWVFFQPMEMRGTAFAG